MARDNGQGMFTMDFINEVSRMKSLPDAKAAVHNVIDASTANDTNKQKAVSMVSKATSLRSLLVSLANFSLSHQGLSVK
jgi:hypothetical protein